LLERRDQQCAKLRHDRPIVGTVAAQLCGERIRSERLGIAQIAKKVQAHRFTRGKAANRGGH
jgi:hypothetical protein